MTVTPSRTVPPQSFAECSSYAKVVSSCASATRSFYSLNPTQLAACVCYSTPATVATTGLGGPVCTGTVEAVVTGAPTLALQNFDKKASACFSYFSAGGYTNVAAMLGGTSNNQSVPTAATHSNATALGPGFCSKVDADVKRAGASLAPTLQDMTWTDCKGLRGSNQVTNGAGVTLNGFDHAVFVSSSCGYDEKFADLKYSLCSQYFSQRSRCSSSVESIDHFTFSIGLARSYQKRMHHSCRSCNC